VKIGQVKNTVTVERRRKVCERQRQLGQFQLKGSLGTAPKWPRRAQYMMHAPSRPVELAAQLPPPTLARRLGLHEFAALLPLTPPMVPILGTVHSVTSYVMLEIRSRAIRTTARRVSQGLDQTEFFGPGADSFPTNSDPGLGFQWNFARQDSLAHGPPNAGGGAVTSTPYLPTRWPLGGATWAITHVLPSKVTRRNPSRSPSSRIYPV